MSEPLSRIAERLRDERPVPRAAFRGALRRRLVDQIDGGGARPRRVRALVAAYAASGICLLLIAAAGVAGAGPLAA